jgi:protocatechuate 3,4-dioxygenase beta subunit
MKNVTRLILSTCLVFLLGAGIANATGTISGKVWVDTNANGVLDPGETTNLAGATVQLFKSGNIQVGADFTTDVTGVYSFGTLDPETYYVKFTAPGGYLIKTPVGGQTGTMVVTIADEVFANVNAGMYQVGTIGDLVWTDLNANGIKEGGETGLAGVSVQLYTLADATVGSAVLTDVNGAYSIANITPGSYYVKFTAPTGYFISPKDAGGDEALDSDADITTGKTATIVITSGLALTNVDAGMYQKGTVGNLVWLDTNGDGLKDAGETGLAGAKAQLFTAANVAVGAAFTTLADGAYSFTNVPIGSYYVKFTVASGYFFSPQNVGGNEAIDSDADLTTGKSATFSITSGQVVSDVDAGMYKKGAIGDRAWKDLNADGILQSTELGFAGVTVKLYKNPSTVAILVGTKITSATGYFTFTGLVPGEYGLEYVIPAGGYVFSPQNVGTATEATDSDVNAFGQVIINLTSGEIINNQDAGINLPDIAAHTIGDKVWIDSNGDGVQDGTETGAVAGASVKLYQGTTLLASTTTSATGTYSFINLIAGTYKVKFTAPSGYFFTTKDAAAAADDTEDSDADPTTGYTADIILAGGVDNLDVDAGIYKKGAIGDRAWKDVNADGILQPTELGFAGVTVKLYKDVTSIPVLVGTKVTSATGYFTFTGLVPGEYGLEYVIPAGGYVFSAQDVGTATEATDSDVDIVSGQTDPILLTSGLVINNQDAGINLPDIAAHTIGDKVWIDSNADGVQDAGETGGVAGASVKLYQGTTLIASTTTSATGAYSFPMLLAGTYQVKFTAPSGYFFTTKDAVAAVEATDSDADPITGSTADIILAGGDDDLDVDAGLYKKGAIGDRAWKDVNADGILQSTELGFAGVTVNLYKLDPVNPPSLVGTKVTSATGYFTFTGLVPGEYGLHYVIPAGGYVFSPQDVGTATEATDSDVDGFGQVIINLTSGLIINNQDAGINLPDIAAHTIGNKVWIDTNGDGIQDVTETGVVKGVSVKLYQGATLLATTTTSATGEYSFPMLIAGTYQVMFTAPSGYFLTIKDAVGTEATDSDADPTTGYTANIVLAGGLDNLDVDAGIYKKGNIGDRAWKDTDEDGLLDANETGFSGIVVNLYDGTGVTLQGTTTTSSTGYYSFTGLVPGSYKLEYVKPLAGFDFTLQDVGAGVNEAIDSDVDATGKTGVITLTSGLNINNQDAGFITAGPIFGSNDRNPIKTGQLNLNGSDVVNTLKVYPNPFQGTCTISFGISQGSRVKIALYDLSGREVDVIAERNYEAGEHMVQYANHSLKAGTYIMRISHAAGANVVRIIVSD